jgi:hypothetical protein
MRILLTFIFLIVTLQAFAERILTLKGSNTIGELLAPELAKAFF